MNAKRMPRVKGKKMFPGKRQQQRRFQEAKYNMRQHQSRFPLGYTTSNSSVPRQTQSVVYQVANLKDFSTNKQYK